jgi:hypothetical protein
MIDLVGLDGEKGSISLDFLLANVFEGVVISTCGGVEIGTEVLESFLQSRIGSRDHLVEILRNRLPPFPPARSSNSFERGDGGMFSAKLVVAINPEMSSSPRDFALGRKEGERRDALSGGAVIS